ncbi:hypothetical protein ACFHW2_11510 [Actinomadura sp. LOL_016]|uniref:hypothetical protein n=1 Tax=unclassified Actinomadura TaxID=2626254 RepID=UPI003A80FAAB
MTDPTSVQRVRLNGGLLVHAIGVKTPYLRTHCDVMVRFHGSLNARVHDQALPPDTKLTCATCARREEGHHVPDTQFRGLTLRQPWAFAVAHAGKRIENRTWTTHYRGLVAIHAGASTGTRHEAESAVTRVAERSGLTEEQVQAGMRVRSAILAVARLTDVCSGSLRTGYNSPPLCDCGPWAVNGQRHLVLTDVHVLSRPEPCRGALGLWHLPQETGALVRDQMQERPHA